ncbi:tRNA uridine-5-carboxymethylaminomethyl(34) synthesis GTPase MnmE [bacterium]|nr:tRNA uridine-5-carboxymethylaminomethyl(34) synthesis GTPase MnmE [bacterium]
MLHYSGESDTIAALATAPGKSGIAVVKLSGPHSVDLMRILFKSTKDPGTYERNMVYGHIVDEHENIDNVLVCVMKSPRSYTGEDVVEIQSHGGSAAAGTILRMLVEAGARIAEPGEFTKRAFLNGKLDLAQAEAVMEIVAAEGREYLRQAERLRDGAFSKSLMALHDTLRECASLVELNLDFLSQDIEAIGDSDLILSLDTVIEKLDAMISSYSAARRIKSGITVIIAGAVNTGKSTLFNTLLGKKRAIVNPSPGTTRDWIEEKIELEGIPVNLIDTAGIRETPDTIEREGVLATEQLLATADIILYLRDASNILQMGSNTTSGDDRYIHIMSKGDLVENPSENPGCLLISARTGRGIDALIGAIAERTRTTISTASTDSLVIVERHHAELVKAREALVHARSSIGTWSEEIISMEIREAQHHIESILGKNIDMDVLDTIFKNFCIGK